MNPPTTNSKPDELYRCRVDHRETPPLSYDDAIPPPLPVLVQMMSPESVHSAMPPNKECEEEDVWSGDSENEEESGPSNHECDETDNNENGKEATGNCEDRVEEPKEGMAFDTPEEAYLYYSSYAKAKGFDVARRTSRKGSGARLGRRRTIKLFGRSKSVLERTTTKFAANSRAGKRSTTKLYGNDECNRQ